MTITITGLPLQGTILDTTLIPVETAGVTGHIAASSIRNYISSAPLTSISAVTGTFTGALVVDSLYSGPISGTTVTASSDVAIAGNLTVAGTSGFTGFSTFVEAKAFGNVEVVGNVNAGGLNTGNLYATIRTGSQPYITALGNITANNANIAANVIAAAYYYPNGTLLTSSNLLAVTSNIAPAANVTYNLGAPTYWWKTIYGVSTQALYADLAEKYESDAAYEPGTVVSFGEVTEVTISTTANDTRVAGVVSTEPAYLMNSGINGVAVALQGRVPCKVIGPVRRGDLMVTSDSPGIAMTNNNPQIGTVIGKALGNHSGEGIGVIEVVVGRI